MTALLFAAATLHAQVSVEAQSAVIQGRAPVVTVAPITNSTVAGQPPAVGHVLHASATATDPDTDTITGTTYRWLRAGVQIGTGQDYTTTSSDAGQTLTVEATATTDSAITDPASGMGTATVAVNGNSAPTATPTIAFDGTLATGKLLTGNPGFNDVDNDAQGVHEYKWYRATSADGTGRTPIDGQTGTTYTVVAADQGKYLVFEVIPHTTTGSPNVGTAEIAVTAIIPGSAPVAKNPRITGRMTVGSVLKAEFDFEDAENDPQGGTLYEWCAHVAGNPTPFGCAAPSTNDTWTLVASNAGNQLSVRVTPKTSSGAPSTGVQVASSRTVTITNEAAPTMSVPTITGTLAVGSMLTGNPQDYADVNNDLAGTHTFKWYRATVATGADKLFISDATSATYTLTDADRNQHLVFEVTPVAATGVPNIGTPMSAVTAIVAGNAPTAAPTITGEARIGQILTADSGYNDAENDPEGGTTYQWCAHAAGNPTPVGCASVGTDNTWTLVSANLGNQLSVRVIPKSASGTPSTGVEASSTMTDIVAGNAPTAAPTISGEVRVGQVLTANPGYNDAEGDPQGATTYQWCAHAAGNPTPTGCASVGTANTWTLVAANLGQQLSVRVIPKSSSGTPATGTVASSPVTAIVVGNAPTAVPTISGLARVGQVLTANSGYNDLEGDPQGGTTYQWCAHTAGNPTPTGCASAGTGNTWTLVDANLGNQLSVRVIPKSASGTPSTGAEASSAMTATVTANDNPIANNPRITGNLDYGQTLSAVIDYDNSGTNKTPGTHVYQWYRATKADGSDKLAISGATGSTYVVQQTTDEGKYFRVRITPRSPAGISGTTVEAATAIETRYRATGGVIVPEGGGTRITHSIVVSRTGNAPANLRVGIWRTDYGDFNSSIPPNMRLVAPDGTRYPLEGARESAATTTIVNASSEIANGTWRLEVDAYAADTADRSYEIAHFTLEFAY